MKKTYSISLLLLSIISLLATFKGCMLFLKPQQGAGNYELSLTIATVIFATTTIYRIIYNFSMKKAETMDEVMALEVDISNILFKINEVLIILLFIFAFSDMGREATIFGLFFDGYDSKEFFLYIFYLLIWIVPSFIRKTSIRKKCR